MLTAAVFAASAVLSRLADAPRPIWPGFGVNTQFSATAKGELDLVAKGGFQYTRTVVSWDETERQAGSYDFSRYDSLLKELKARRIRPIFCLSGGNIAFQVGAPTMPDARAAFARWAGEAANHFKGEEVVWELWDAPNTDRSWKPSPSASDYSMLAVEAAKAMRLLDSGCRILAPGTASVDSQFLSSALSTELLGLVDGVSIHADRAGGPESIVADVRQVRDLIKQRAPDGRKELPIVCTGWGYSTARGKNSEGRQAMYVSRMWLLNSALGVPVTIYDSWQDNGANPDEPGDRLGLVRENLDLKPSYIAAKEVLERFRGCTNFRWLPQKDPLDWVIVGAGNNRLVQARWYQKEAGVKYTELSLRDKKFKTLYATLMGGDEPVVLPSVQAPPKTVLSKPMATSLAGMEFAFAPPLDEDGWCVLVEKSAATSAKLEFKYQRPSGANVTCYAKIESARTVEPLALSEPKVSISVGMNGTVGGSFTAAKAEISAGDWSFAKEGRLSGELVASQGGLLLTYDGAGKALVSAKGRQRIPDGAKAMVVWVRPDGTGNRLKSEYRNEKGETVSVELFSMEGATDRSGWRVVKIPLNGNATEWVALLTVEAERERGGAIEIGPAAYMF